MNYHKKIEIDGADGIFHYLGREKNKNSEPDGPDYLDRNIKRKTFENLYFKGTFSAIKFSGCKFKNCEFEGVYGFFFLLKKCKFLNCSFRQTKFRRLEMEWDDVEFKKCNFRNVELDEGYIYNIFFFDCTITGFSMFNMEPMTNVIFRNCEIEQSYFSHLQTYTEGEEIDTEFFDIAFIDSRIDHSFYNTVDLRYSIFADTMLFKTSFLDCYLGKNSIVLEKELKYESYASMDFQTIVKSDLPDKKILKTFFNIPESANIKKIIGAMIKPKIFSTVFISYSFKDAQFASRLNEVLNKKGIRTFIWEKDAEGGTSLDEIMTSGINEHDKLLFIASEHSIRSKACQFEITTARKKQEHSWKNVFFPIYIDSYLFTVTKSVIRPVDSADEYWKNIEEIKRVNALDFSKFNVKTINNREFSKAVNAIVKGLRITA